MTRRALYLTAWLTVLLGAVSLYLIGSYL